MMTSPYIPFSQERVKQYQLLAYWQGQTHFDFFTTSCSNYGDNIALVEGDYELSYRSLYQAAVNFGDYLRNITIHPNDFVMLQSPNSIDFVIALFGIYYIGARPVFCLNGHRHHEIRHIAQASKASAYLKIKDSPITESAEDIVNKIPKNLHALSIIKTFNQGELVNFARHTESISTVQPQKATSIAFLQLSGGTTGAPKLIPRTHDEYLYTIRESANIAGLSQDSVQLVALPIAHNFAMSSPGILSALYTGAKIVIASNGSPDQCFELIQKHRITQVSLVPSLVTLWANSSKLQYYDLTSLEVVQVGGARLSPILAKRFITSFPKITLQQVYGMAEGLVNYTRLDDSETTIIYTQGCPISPHDEILIVDPQLNPLAIGEVGEIITRGPYTINGYYNAPQINKKSFTPDGFYRTGDLGYINNEGRIVVTGRCKEIINKGGEKIIPSELETIFLMHPDIKDASVIGLPDPLLGEKIHVYLILHANKTIQTRELKAYLNSQGVDKIKHPDHIEFVSTFDYTLVGKVRKSSH